MMSKDKKENNEVYILGSEENGKKKKLSLVAKLLIFLACIAVIVIGIYLVILLKKEPAPEYYFEPEVTPEQSVSVSTNDPEFAGKEGYLEILEDTVNDVPLRVFIPYEATMTLSIGIPDKSDSTILYTTMAADIRKDNMQIVGDFVLFGEQLARGVAKKGFCAINNETVTVGVGESTPLLEKVIENKGSFFRQYPLVHNGEIVENKPKNKSIRHALAVRNDQIIMVSSRNIESFHDFSQSLIDIGVSDAIYLVGGNAYGWYYNKEHVRQEFGKEQPNVPENISYIVWRLKK